MFLERQFCNLEILIELNNSVTLGPFLVLDQRESLLVSPLKVSLCYFKGKERKREMQGGRDDFFFLLAKYWIIRSIFLSFPFLVQGTSVWKDSHWRRGDCLAGLVFAIWFEPVCHADVGDVDDMLSPVWLQVPNLASAWSLLRRLDGRCNCEHMVNWVISTGLFNISPFGTKRKATQFSAWNRVICSRCVDSLVA